MKTLSKESCLRIVLHSVSSSPSLLVSRHSKYITNNRMFYDWVLCDGFESKIQFFFLCISLFDLVLARAHTNLIELAF